MLREDKSSTTLSKSSTVERGVFTHLQYVKGVGPKLGALLVQRGLTTVRDLFYHFPRVYEDRSQVQLCSELTIDMLATVSGQIASVRRLGPNGRMMEARLRDASGTVALKWFHVPRGLPPQMRMGRNVTAIGKVTQFGNLFQIVHPELKWGQAVDAGGGQPPRASSSAQEGSTTLSGSQDSPDFGRICPVYSEIDGLQTRFFRRILWSAIQQYLHTMPEDVPSYLLARHALPAISDSIRKIHFPDASDLEKTLAFDAPAHHRLIYEEFLKFELLILRQKLRVEKMGAPIIARKPSEEARKALERQLPFVLTGGQTTTLNQILDDLAAPHPMNRLVQGDVGSGKTAVALIAAGTILAQGGQVALMAPTEILAEQHFHSLIKLFGDRLSGRLLTGKTPASARAVLLGELTSGRPMLVIGTHALIEDPVVFSSLQLVIVDEQHRFGVEQRRKLRHKGYLPSKNPEKKGILPHFLVLSATPIPRTLALTIYGDLSVSSISELPPGRQPISTQLVQSDQDRERALETIRVELRAGRQAYFVFPLVSESEAEGFEHLKSATVEAERLAQEDLRGFGVELLHGQMTPEQKAEAMARFKSGRSAVLVSTTVIEVGVDVPNATIMAIEHAERFGLSQLHQLRGRVGRGQFASRCYLFSRKKLNAETAERLKVFEKTNSGFEIAEADLKIRGPGEFLGTRQAGALPFKIGDIVRDQSWLFKARDDAQEVLKKDPDLELAEHARLRGFFAREGLVQSDRLKTS